MYAEHNIISIKSYSEEMYFLEILIYVLHQVEQSLLIKRNNRLSFSFVYVNYQVKL